MNPQSQSLEVTKIDDELIYDIDHILMNYLKLNLFSSQCFSDTTIQISSSIKNTSLTQEQIQSYNKFATKYFTLFKAHEEVVDILSYLISNYPNSNFGLFLSSILNNHIIDNAQKLDNSPEKFEKYKNNLFKIYHSILQGNKKQKVLEFICSSITVLIIIGVNGNWKNGLEQLISAAKETGKGGDLGNLLMATLIISNIHNIFDKLKENLSIKNSENILAYIKINSNIITQLTEFIITEAFKGCPNEKYINTPLFKSFIGIVQSFKYFDLNIIKMHGFIEFLIKCLSFIDINQELILQICDIFQYTFSDKNNIGLIYPTNSELNLNNFIEFLNYICNHKDFQEIKKCIELIMNVKNYYSSKDINEIKSDEKHIQILFASCNIFSSLIENYGYIFFLPGIDSIVEEIYFYFINLPLLRISQILLGSMKQIMFYIHYGYKFNNYNNGESNGQNEKLSKFNSFLYKVHNSVFQNMKLSSLNEYNNINFDSFSLSKNDLRLDKNILELLKSSIDNDEKINYNDNVAEFYENLYEILNDLYEIKDFCNKLCQYLKSSIENNDLITIDCIFSVINKFSFRLNYDMPDIIFNMIDFLLNDENHQNVSLLVNYRYSLQLISLILNMKFHICSNKIYLNLIVKNFISQKYDIEVMNLIVLNFISKIIIVSYQTHKNNNKKELTENDKNAMTNLFDVISQYLIKNMQFMNHVYLLKIVDSLFTSCFFNIYLSIYNNDIISNIMVNLLKSGNQLFNSAIKSNDKNNLYLKYIYLIYGIIKNVSNENSQMLIELFEKIEPNPNNSNELQNITYIKNIENNLMSIINDCSEKKSSYDKNIIDSVINLCVLILKSLKNDIIKYYNDFSGIISILHQMNPSNVKVFELSINLYKNILTFCKNDPKFNEVSELFFDILNVMNSKFNLVSEDNKILLSKNICEYIILYLTKVPLIVSQIADKDNQSNSVFSFGFNELINVFENDDNDDYNLIFTNLLKALCENNIIFNLYIKDYVIRLSSAIISHLQNFKNNSNSCIHNYFIILKYFSTYFKEQFNTTLKRIFDNDAQIIYVIEKYFDCVRFKNYNNLEPSIKDNNKSFLKEIGELMYAIDKKKIDFVSKFDKIVHQMGNNRKELLDSCEKNKYEIGIIHK